MAQDEIKDKDIKERIRQIIDNLGINDATFSQSLGINRSTISQCINGSTGVSKDLLFKIHEKYPQYSFEWLCFGIGDPILGNRPRNPLDFPSQNEIFNTNADVRPEYGRDLGLEFPSENTFRTDAKPVISPKVPVCETVKVEIKERRVLKIMLYYSDNTFETYSLDKI